MPIEYASPPDTKGRKILWHEIDKEGYFTIPFYEPDAYKQYYWNGLIFSRAVYYDHKEQQMANVIKTIQDAVASQIAKLGPRVEADVVDLMVDKELKKRTPAIVQGLEKLVELEKEYEKTDTPDLIARDREGKVLSAAYTSKKLEETKKAKDKLEKLSKAIEKAFEHGDLKDLNQLLQSSGGKDKKEGGTEATGEAS